MTDNIRYIGDVFIDGKTDILLREFLTNLFDQYNGEGKGFNADMLDGHHYSDIEFELNELGANKISEIRIGDSIFNADNAGAFLHFSDVIYNGDTEEWMTNITNQYNISQALSDLYEYLLETIDNTAELKVDKEKVDPDDNSSDPRMKVLSDNNFSDQDKQNLDDLSEGFLNQMTDYIDVNGTAHHMFNAQLINGLRLILITQSDYDALSSDFKNYWRNIFIIKEPSEMPTAIDYSSPLEYRLEDGYDFRVAQDDEPMSDFNLNDDGSGRDFWLQLKHKWDDTWTNLMPLQRLLDGTDFRAEITDIIQNNENIVYNKHSVKNTIQQILTNTSDDDYLDLPYLPSEYKDDFIHQILKNGTPIEGINDNGFTNIDLGTAFDSDFTTINNKIDNIANTQKTGTLDVEINNLTQRIDAINTQLNSPNDTSITNTLQSLSAALTDTANRIQTITGVTSNVNTWNRKYLGGYIWPKDATSAQLTAWYNKAEAGNANLLSSHTHYYISQVLYNQTLGLARVYLSFAHWHKKANANKWVRPQVKYKGSDKKYHYKTWYYFNRDILNNRVNKPIRGTKNQSPASIPDASKETWTSLGEYKPFATTIFPNANSPQSQFIMLHPSIGDIYVRATYDKDVILHFYGSCVYALAGGPHQEEFELELEEQGEDGE